MCTQNKCAKLHTHHHCLERNGEVFLSRIMTRIYSSGRAKPRFPVGVFFSGLLRDMSLCHHKGPCTVNTVKGLIRGLVAGYAVKSGLNLAIALVMQRAWKRYNAIPRFRADLG